MILLDMHKRVQQMTYQDKRFEDVCLKIPITDILLGNKRRRRRRQAVEESQTSSTTLSSSTSTTTEPSTTTSTTASTTIATTTTSTTTSTTTTTTTTTTTRKSTTTTTTTTSTTTSEEEEEEYDYYGGFSYAYDSPASTDDKDEEEESESKKEDDDDDDPNDLDSLPPEIYCDIVDTLQDKCGEYSLLEIWKYDEDVIRSLTQQDIIDAVNTLKESPVFGYEVNFTDYLGGKVYNETGHVVGAKSLRSIWLQKFDPDNIESTQKLTGFEVDLVDAFTMAYEAELIKLFRKIDEEISERDDGHKLYFNVARSFVDEASGPIEFDILRMIAGYGLMFLYTMLTLGKLNRVEHKLYLALVGLLAVLFGFMLAVGTTMALGMLYTPVHGLLPFICLGIGIDDMFVIMRCFNNIPTLERERRGLPKTIGMAMQHAGVSITVTTLTDVFAFAVGGMTVFPSLFSFCMCSAIAIAAIFVFQTSWFVAWMTLDHIRIQQKRDGLFPCIVHENWEPPTWSQKDYGNLVMSQVSKVLEIKPFQVQ